MDDIIKLHCRNLHEVEQLAAGLDEGDVDSEKRARNFLNRVALNGSPQLISRDVFHGIILVWDANREAWEELTGMDLQRFMSFDGDILLGDADCQQYARSVVANIATHASCAMLAQLFHGQVAAWDVEQPLLDKIAEDSIEEDS